MDSPNKVGECVFKREMKSSGRQLVRLKWKLPCLVIRCAEVRTWRAGLSPRHQDCQWFMWQENGEGDMDGKRFDRWKIKRVEGRLLGLCIRISLGLGFMMTDGPTGLECRVSTVTPRDDCLA